MPITLLVNQITAKLEQWGKTHFSQSEDNTVNILLEDIALLENHPNYTETAFVIFRINPLEVIYLSKTINKKYFFTNKAALFQELLGTVDKSHLSFVSRIIDLISHGKKIMGKTRRFLPKLSILEIKIKANDGARTIALHNHFLMFDDSGAPIVFMISIDDISILFESEHYWIRYEATNADNEEKQVLYFGNEENKIFEHDIISIRELEILKLMRAGLDLASIAKNLNISVNTVNKHKQNMYKRTGARNSTALIELAIMCGIL